MALAFKTKEVATAKLRETDTKKLISTPGVAHDITTPATYATQINKILDIGGKSVTADAKMTVTQIKEVYDDGN